MAVAVLERGHAVGVEDHIEALGRDALGFLPEILRGLVDDVIAAVSARGLDLLASADDAGHRAAGELAELHQASAHAACGRVNQQVVGGQWVRQRVEREVGGEEDGGDGGALDEGERVGERKDLMARCDERGGVAVEEGDCDDAGADGQIGHALAHRRDLTRYLEARRDGPADQLLGGGVEAHAHDDVGVVDAGSLHVDEHLALAGLARLLRRQAQLVVGAGAIDHDLGRLLGERARGAGLLNGVARGLVHRVCSCRHFDNYRILWARAWAPRRRVVVGFASEAKRSWGGTLSRAVPE